MDKEDLIFKIIIAFMIISTIIIVGLRIANLIPEIAFKLHTLAMSLTSLGVTVYINKQMRR